MNSDSPGWKKRISEKKLQGSFPRSFLKEHILIQIRTIPEFGNPLLYETEPQLPSSIAQLLPEIVKQFIGGSKKPLIQLEQFF